MTENRAPALLVTATPPTPNGDLHLGHFSGPYLAADVFARHARRVRDGVVAATGIDDHQSYTDLRAYADGRTPGEVAQHFGDRIVAAWQNLGLRWDVVSRPRVSDQHRPMVDSLVTTLRERGHVVARTRPLPWCSSCDAWAFEAYVRGKCPHCGVPACGNACEICCRPNDCADLVDPECNRCGAPCELRDCERLYFPLEPHRAVLERFWSTVRMNGHLAKVCAQMADEGLPEIAVSHPSPWGIPIPGTDFPAQTVYVWVEMAAGYLATAAECAGGDWREFWRDGSVVQFFGIDNGYFHAVLFPALMSAYEPGIALPTAFIGNEFYLLEGLKFSTSRRHVIWIDDALAEAPADHLRLYLCLDRPKAAQTSFSWPRLRARIDGDVLVRWSSWLAAAQRRLDLLRARDGGAAVGRPLDPVVRKLFDAVSDAFSVAEFSPRRACQLVDLLATEAAESAEEDEHVADTPAGSQRLIAAVERELTALAAFAAALSPLAPTMAEQLWTALGLAGSAATVRWDDVPAVRVRSTSVVDLPRACPLFAPSVGDRS